MRMPPDYCLLGRRQSGVVTDGLIFWLDGRDDVVVQDASSTSGQTFLNRADNTYMSFDVGNVKNTVSSDGLYYKLTQTWVSVPTNISNPYGTYMSTEVVLGNVKNISSCYMYVVCNDGTYTDYHVLVNNGTLTVQYKYNMHNPHPVLYTLEGLTYPSHIVLAFDGAGNAKIYLNGERVFSGNSGSEYAPTTPILNPTKILRCIPSTGDTIGTIRLYDRTLSDREILQNYNYEKSLGRVT